MFKEHWINLRKRKGYEYFIDFGEDSEGAARLLSKIWKEVYEIPLDANVEYYTNAGGDNVVKARKAIEAERDGENDTSQIPWWGWAIGAFILFKLIQWLF